MVDAVILAECQSLECRFLKSVKQCTGAHPRCFNRSLDWRMRRKGFYGIY